MRRGERRDRNPHTLEWLTAFLTPDATLKSRRERAPLMCQVPQYGSPGGDVASLGRSRVTRLSMLHKAC